MPKKIEKPLSKNHYDYLNELLEKSGSDSLTKDTKLDDAKKAQLIEDLEKQQADFKAMADQTNADVIANLKKIKNVLDTLGDDEKKAAYDQGLSAKASPVKLKSGQDAIAIVPLVPIEKITAEFDAFTSDRIGQDKPGSGGGKYQASDFSHEHQPGPPDVHIYTFPDKESADAFLQQLFDKNMAMLPGGSQNMADARPTPQEPTLKERLSTERTAALEAMPGAITGPPPMTPLESAHDDEDELDKRGRLTR